MEPVFMILGQSAATAASHAIDEDVAVQDVDYDKLQKRLIADGQVLEFTQTFAGNGIAPEKVAGLVIDDTKAEFTGKWKSSSSHKSYLGFGYQHDNGAKDGTASATFRVKVPKPGWYEVRLAYTPNNNRATNVPVTISHTGGQSVIIVNEREEPQIDGMFEFLGSYEFIEDATITITNKGTDGYVVIDGAQWVAVDQ